MRSTPNMKVVTFQPLPWRAVNYIIILFKYYINIEFKVNKNTNLFSKKVPTYWSWHALQIWMGDCLHAVADWAYLHHGLGSRRFWIKGGNLKPTKSFQNVQNIGVIKLVNWGQKRGWNGIFVGKWLINKDRYQPRNAQETFGNNYAVQSRNISYKIHRPQPLKN